MINYSIYHINLHNDEKGNVRKSSSEYYSVIQSEKINHIIE